MARGAGQLHLQKTFLAAVTGDTRPGAGDEDIERALEPFAKLCRRPAARECRIRDEPDHRSAYIADAEEGLIPPTSNSGRPEAAKQLSAPRAEGCRAILQTDEIRCNSAVRLFNSPDRPPKFRSSAA
jgi:hypothetical protein